MGSCLALAFTLFSDISRECLILKQQAPVGLAGLAPQLQGFFSDSFFWWCLL